MATGDRVKRLLTNVRSVLGDEGDAKLNASPKSILDSLNRTQRRIAEEAMCIEDSTDITVDSENCDFPDGMIHERVLIPSGSVALRHIDMSEVDKLKRGAQSSESTSDSMQFYYKWQGQFGFLSAYGTAPTSESTITVYYWRYPSTSEEMTETKDPVLESLWDTALYYGAVSDLTADQKWEGKFLMELGRRVMKERSVRGEPSRIPTNQEYD
jgi:hypothetical protein